MDFLLFIFFLIITLIGYYVQCSKIYKNKSSFGISFHAYIISFVATFSLIINSYSQQDYVFILAISELLLLVIGLFLIYKYKQEPLEKISIAFLRPSCTFTWCSLTSLTTLGLSLWLMPENHFPNRQAVCPKMSDCLRAKAAL